MSYVCVLQSSGSADRFYVSVTADLKARLPSTTPANAYLQIPTWALKTYIAFADGKKGFCSRSISNPVPVGRLPNDTSEEYSLNAIAGVAQW